MKRIEERNHVRQSNFNAWRKPEMSLNEQRLYFTTLAQVTEGDTTATEYKISVCDFLDLFKMGSDTGLYTEVKKVAKNLMRKQFEKLEFNSKGKEIAFEMEHIIKCAKYRSGEAAVSIWLSETSLEHAIKNKRDGNFNFFVLENIVNLSSGNAVRFFELINSWKGMTKKEIPLLELKDLMWLGHKYIGNNSGFIRAVLEPCATEVSKKTNLTVKYTLKGAGKKREIDFRITVKKEAVPSVKSDGEPKKIKKWPRLGIVRGQTEYYTLMNLVKEDSPATWYGDKPGAYKAKEKYLDYYLGQAEWMLDQDSLLTREEALTMLKKMLKEDSDQKTFYKLMELQGFDKKTENRAHGKACRQVAARDAGIEQHKVKKLEKENGKIEEERAQM